MKSFKQYVTEVNDKKDIITLNIPLMIRMLELAREDVKDDMELHRITERLIDIRDKGVLTMDDYDFIAGLKEELEIDDEMITELRTSTMLRYATKANKALIGGDRNKEPKRIKGIQTANYKIQQKAKKVQEEVEELDEASPAWQRAAGKDPEGGLNRKGIASYRRENPGSKLSMAVTTKPSKLKKGSKAANRRKSFCARMSGMKKRLTSAKTAKDPNSRINKSLRKWNC